MSSMAKVEVLCWRQPFVALVTFVVCVQVVFISPVRSVVQSTVPRIAVRHLYSFISLPIKCTSFDLHTRSIVDASLHLLRSPYLQKPPKSYHVGVSVHRFYTHPGRRNGLGSCVHSFMCTSLT